MHERTQILLGCLFEAEEGEMVVTGGEMVVTGGETVDWRRDSGGPQWRDGGGWWFF